MPRYDFKCRDCGHVHEYTTLTSTTVLRCERCDGLADKQPAAPSFVVNGFNAKNGYAK